MKENKQMSIAKINKTNLDLDVLLAQSIQRG